MIREQISKALLSLLSGGSNFVTIGRRLVHWNQVDGQPALFLRNVGEDWPQRPTGKPAAIVIELEAWVYTNGSTDPDVSGAEALLPLIDAVTDAIKPPPGPWNVQTLNGLVAHCWIEGRVDMATGDLGGQAIAIIPIKVLVPSFGS